MFLSLSLKIIGAVLLAFIITFVIIKNKKFLWPSIALIVGLTVWQGIKQYNLLKPDLVNAKASIIISASDLIHEYQANDSLSNQKYLGKIVEVTGNIKEIKKNERGFYKISLGDSISSSFISCSMDSTHQRDILKLISGNLVTIRGVCDSVNKSKSDFGPGIELNRSVIIKQKN